MTGPPLEGDVGASSVCPCGDRGGTGELGAGGDTEAGGDGYFERPFNGGEMF